MLQNCSRVIPVFAPAEPSTSKEQQMEVEPEPREIEEEKEKEVESVQDAWLKHTKEGTGDTEELTEEEKKAQEKASKNVTH